MKIAPQCRVLSFLLFFTVSLAQAQWVRTAKSRAFSRTNGVATDFSGNVYTAGIFSCIGVFGTDSLLNNSCGEVTPPSPAVPQVDAFLAKRDDAGNLLWVRQFSGSVGNKIAINDVATDPLGNCYITGSFTGTLDLIASPFSNPDATTEYFLAKILPDGTVAWALSDPLNAASESYAERISATADAVFITGTVRGDFRVGALTDSVGRDASFVASFGPDGTALWTKSFMEVNGNGASHGKAIEAQGDSLWVFSSFTDSVRIEGNVYRPPGSVATATAGILSLYNAGGTLLSQALTNTPLITGMRLHRPDASLYITGRAENITEINGDTLFNSTGVRAYVSSHSLDLATLQWVTPVTAPTTAALTTTDLAVSLSGNIFASGTYQGTSLSSLSTSAAGGGAQNGFLLKLDATGADHWLQSYGGAGDDALLTVASRDDDRTYIGGYFDQYIRVAGEEQTSASSNGMTARIDVCPQLVADMLSADSTYICDRAFASFQVTDNAAYTYQWYRDDSPVAGAQSAGYNAEEEGIYRVRVSQGACAKFTPAARLFLLPLPDSVVVAQTPLQNCQGNIATLVGPIGPYTFQWLETGTAIPETNKDIDVTTDGDYRLRITDNAGCSILSDTFAIRFLPYPAPALTPAGGKYTLCSGNALSLQADQSQPGMTWQWRKDDLAINGAVSATYAATTSGIYHAVVRNSIGCETITEPDTVIVQASPLVDLNDENLPDEVCDGTTLRLVTPIVMGQTYQWRRDGADISGATTNVLDVATAGTYSVRVRNTLCEKVSASFKLSVNPLPTAVIDNATASVICEGDPYTLSAIATTGDSYQWFRNGQAIAGAVQHAWAVDKSGNYAVKVTNAFNCQQTSAATSILVNLKPPATITPEGPTTFCAGEAVVLRANPGTGLSYQWMKDGAVVPGSVQGAYETFERGAFEVLVTNGNGCTRRSAPVNVQVVAIPTATVVSPAGTNTLCERDSLELHAGADPAYNFQWYFNDQLIPEASSSVYYAKDPGNYHVVASAGVCRDTASVLTLEVRPNPLPVITRNEAFLSIAQFGDIQWYRNDQPIPGATLQVVRADSEGAYSVNVINMEGCSAWSSVVPVCLPLPAIQKVNDVLTVSVQADQYYWKYQQLPISGATSRVLTAQQSGSYSAVVSADGCTMETGPVTVCVPYPFINRDDFTGVLLASPNPAAGYQWYWEGKPIPGATTQVHIPEGPGTYRVTVRDLEGCISSSESFTIAPITGTEPVFFQQVHLYPNPARDVLLIENASPAGGLFLRIFDTAGRMIKVLALSESAYAMDVSQLSPGVYTVVVQAGRHTRAWKLVKQ